jgi:hypothetical protein
MAKASLRQNWHLAEVAGALSDEEIDREIDQVRRQRSKAK